MINISTILHQAVELHRVVYADATIQQRLYRTIEIITHCYRNGGKVLLCGNGGSAADAQHLAAELTGRFYFDRAPLDAEALHVNTSYLTAVANDYSYDEVFSRLVQAKGQKGDVLVAFSTSGSSNNVLRAIQTAKKIGLTIIGFTGNKDGTMKPFCDVLFNVPSDDTPRIQEIHILLGHIVCQGVEEEMFKRERTKS